jgi:GTP-binding protein HflX
VLQVALARMEYSLPRLTRAWTHLSRQRGKGKMGGEGETQLEQDRRIVRDRITRLKRELIVVQKQRGVQRRKRQRVPVPTCAIVGYTNAGKSSLLNSAHRRRTCSPRTSCFATLDPTTRQLVLRGNQKLLVTDTVGFIRRLPHRLVEAFKATLEETIVADFLIHVLDVANPDVEEAPRDHLSCSPNSARPIKTMITVFNKVDAADAALLRPGPQAHPRRHLRQRPHRCRPRCCWSPAASNSSPMPLTARSCLCRTTATMSSPASTPSVTSRSRNIATTASSSAAASRPRSQASSRRSCVRAWENAQ